MSGELRPYDPTWLDREYRKSLAKLDVGDQERTKKELSELLAALQNCRHPVTDPSLAKWNPKPYGVGIRGLYEYTLAPLSRVIARCTDVTSNGPIVLVAATLCHDRPRIKRLIDEHKTRIKNN